MIKNTKDALLALLCLITTQMIAQQPTVNVLEPGDKVPDLLLSNFYNQPNKKNRLSEMNKKLVILDFWNIWCTACITSFPKLDSLQRKFNDQIQIILVTNNNAVEVKKIFSKSFLKNVNLPIIISDSLLDKLFPFQIVPHHVWINDAGTVEYITHSHNTNEKSIADYLAGNKPILAYKNEQNHLDFSKPFWAKENYTFSKNIKYYSYSSGWISEYGGSGRSRFLDSTKKLIGMKFINESLLSLYQAAFGGFDGGIFRYSNRVILSVSEKGFFHSPTDNYNMDDWNTKNLACYEISVPSSQKSELLKLMQSDMSRFFGYCANVEKRKVKCLSLIRTSSKDKIRSTQPIRKVIKTDSSLIITNETIGKALLERLKIANADLQTPIIDETGYSDKVDLTLRCSLTDISSLITELRRYDLDLVLVERELDMLVIADKNTCCLMNNRY